MIVLEVLEQTDEQLIAVRISKQLKLKDYVVLRTLFNDRLDHDEPLLWYIEMVEFEDWGPSELWSDFMMKVHQASHRPLSRVAFVADRHWEDWIGESYQWLLAIYPSQPAETKFLPVERRDEALNWVGAQS